MCFVPSISISIAILEFTIAIFILIYFEKSTRYRLISLLIFMLGAYQLTEFMLCRSGNPFLWAKIGFIIYTFLPAVLLHYARNSRNTKSKNYLLYIIPLAATLYALFVNNFIVSAECLKYHINVNTMIYQFYSLLIPYALYYFGFIAFLVYILWKAFKEEKNIKIKYSKLISLIATATLGLGAIALYFFLPKRILAFPSVFCIFALVFTIMIIVDAYYLKKNKKHSLISS